MTREQLEQDFIRVRRTTEELCAPLAIEDYVVQTIGDVSPPKWHIGHTTWFYEQVILTQFVPNYQPCDQRLYWVFNSYYESFGNRVVRTSRGTLSRPTVSEVMAYRRAVDERMRELIGSINEARWAELCELVILGLNHEQQHQELLVTDIKHIFASNPLLPEYAAPVAEPAARAASPRFVPCSGGVIEIGNNGNGRFAYDNELPRHKTYVDDYVLMDRLVTCGEFLEFIDDGGYANVDLWLSDGWDLLGDPDRRKPFYWFKDGDQWQVITLRGIKPVDPAEPICHVSYYEAAAYAQWKGMHLPTEVEWEHAATSLNLTGNGGNFLDSKRFHPAAAPGGEGLRQMYGDVWEWTLSAYLPYPGYQRVRGALGEYNGKFMSDQMVLRGGSCATPLDHFRPTYRNFFQCEKRWQFTGFRLAGKA